MNKKEHLKPAFILCGVVAVVIIILFVVSGNVNKNVVKNLTGKVLYTEEGSGVRQYNFDDGTDTLISGDVSNACYGNFAGGKIFFAGTDENGIWNIYDEDKEVIYQMPEKAEILGMTAYDKIFAAAYVMDGEYSIVTYDTVGKKEVQLMSSDKEIPALCMDDEGEQIYFAQMDGSDCVLKSVSVSGGNEQKILKGENERITCIAFRNDVLYMCEEKENSSTISQYNLSAKRAVTLEFSSDDYNCVTICPVYDKEYIVSSDKDGVFGVYVCNGSNMVKADDAGTGKNCYVTSYMNLNK